MERDRKTIPPDRDAGTQLSERTQKQGQVNSHSSSGPAHSVHREVGILFTPPNITAILENRKTQTRRIIKPQPPEGCTIWQTEGIGDKWQVRRCDPWHSIKCPYGTVGDRLYCKEAHYRFGKWVRNGRTKTGRQKWRFKIHLAFPVKFDLDGGDCEIRITDKHRLGWQKRSPLFMPKLAARLWLELTGVRVERLHDISEEDCLAEGVQAIHHGDGAYYFSAFRTEPHPKNWVDPIDAYQELWESPEIHGPGSWDLNLWLWVLEYKRVKG